MSSYWHRKACDLAEQLYRMTAERNEMADKLAAHQQGDGVAECPDWKDDPFISQDERSAT